MIATVIAVLRFELEPAFSDASKSAVLLSTVLPDADSVVVMGVEIGVGPSWVALESGAFVVRGGGLCCTRGQRDGRDSASLSGGGDGGKSCRRR